ncbi:AbiH family protein [Mesonia aestuariivivens]|uniref:Bacteriophage abortive infection AbiH family protein n=1 Tax=Mesonia aestuariivivens TaxID=2796128 RepID=A0ABS6W066_9FLAO|nr:AbiH family protein [Mesonia aestuariivivens]MBW2960911.1 bacteriophage abortive infection AbiH family protein [Mesonia aestuariivivens]
MNRIILIGNGFDLAHGMKTTYKDFLDSFWSNKINNIKNTFQGRIFEDEDILIKNVPTHLISECSNYQEIKSTLNNYGSKIEYKNLFLEKITEQGDLKKWVDIENEYYILLKNCYKGLLTSNINISKLNKDFQRIKDLLNDYLVTIEEGFNKIANNTPILRKRNSIGHKIFSKYKIKELTEKLKNLEIDKHYELVKNDYQKFLNKDGTFSEDLLDEYRKKLFQRLSRPFTKKDFRELLSSEYGEGCIDLTPEQTLILNFNYTSTDSFYSNPSKYKYYSFDNVTNAQEIHIHGSNKIEDENPIIFGFGDELDEDYKEIEKLNDNQYLENIKSIKYLETDNYKKLLEFANSDYYQICIMGHSCGTSDRTMLNTLFEHKNCCSIKVYYHQKDEKHDNYSNIVMNISRNFNDKKKMRERVVNKTYCSPLC